MPQITAITEHHRKPGRYIVDLDAQELCVVGADAIATVRVRVGDVVDAAVVARLRELASDTALYDRAVRLLAVRARSSTELRRKLSEPGQPAARIDAVIDKLTRAGLLDDEAYARLTARQKLVGARASRRRTAQELARRGIARDAASEAIDEVMADESVDERAMAVDAARKRARALRSLAPDVQRRRLYAFLARRGYDPDAIRRAIDVVLDADAPADDA